MTSTLRQWVVTASGLLATLLAPGAWGKECLQAFVPPTEAALSAAAQQAQDRGFLWKISKAGKHSYLYGTIHLGRLEWWAPGPKVQAAMDDSRVLALEMDLSDTATVTQLMQGMRAQAGDSRLAPELTARLRQQAESECIDWKPLEGLRTEFQLSTVLVAAARRHRLEPAYGAETMLTAMAKHQKKPLRALETVDEQLSALRASNLAELTEMMAESLSDLESGAATQVLVKLARAWAGSDATTLQNYEQWCDCMNSQAERAMARRLLDERNLTLASRIDELHAASAPVFGAVGALHMFGAAGLPALLKARGYTVDMVF
ncbi:TraB/GumN family protein [Ottowia thiooxydans]|uniref:TraB/GumN family protein n=1 Tax=Ottowia thiooxydans TaxID=219182 RepID=UPI00040FC3D3|nr:TraB/GumN family protein [Ottowia thiooxydans]